MVETQLIPRGIKDQRVINAMLKVPRHLFVEEGLYDQAYNDYPLPIGEGQTISQPYMVALMTEALGITSSDNILEIGTGSGYQTAILSKLAGKVYSIERIPVLASKARKVLDYLSCPNVIVKISDGTVGWPEYVPFNGIIVAAASPALPEAYIEQMADDGVLIIPVGSEFDQNLMRFKKTPKGIVEDNLGGCKFVKLVGKFGWSN